MKLYFDYPPILYLLFIKKDIYLGWLFFNIHNSRYGEFSINYLKESDLLNFKSIEVYLKRKY